VAGATGLGRGRARLAGGIPLETGGPTAPRPPRRTKAATSAPYGTDNAAAAMQAYLDWEFGLVEQLRRDGTHGFFVI
jgi:hypothetical protein